MIQQRAGAFGGKPPVTKGWSYRGRGNYTIGGSDPQHGEGPSHGAGPRANKGRGAAPHPTGAVTPKPPRLRRQPGTHHSRHLLTHPPAPGQAGRNCTRPLPGPAAPLPNDALTAPPPPRVTPLRESAAPATCAHRHASGHVGPPRRGPRPG